MNNSLRFKYDLPDGTVAVRVDTENPLGGDTLQRLQVALSAVETFVKESA